MFRTIKNYTAIILLILLASCGSKSAQQQQMMQPPPAVPVTVQTVTTGKATYYDQYPATVTALNQVELRPQVSGYITGIFFKDGNKVSKGQKLYSIDQQQYQANYQQALANVAVQQTNLVKAQKDADRYHELEKQDAIAKQQVGAAAEPLGSAWHGNLSVAAVARVAGEGRLLLVEAHIVGDEEVEQAIAIVVEKAAARAPPRGGAGHARFH